MTTLTTPELHVPSFIIYVLINTLYLYLSYSLTHLTFRNCLKTLLIPSLILVYYQSVTQTDKLLLVTLYLAFQGDTLLLFQQLLIAGACTFFTSDCLYLYLIYNTLDNINYIHLSIFAMIASLWYIIYVYPTLYKYLGNLKVRIFLFGFPLLMMSVCSIYKFMLDHTMKNAVMAFGAMNYCVSDYVLIRGWYKAKVKHYDFVVMVTYLTANACLVYALN